MNKCCSCKFHTWSDEFKKEKCEIEGCYEFSKYVEFDFYRDNRIPMKIIFLDIDGVLNYKDSKSRIYSFIGIDNKRVKLLKKIISMTNAKIVLCSSWKDDWSLNKEEQTEHGNYLDRKLRNEGLYILDKTKDNNSDRGHGIHKWINSRNVTNWIVLDDEIFDDYDEEIIKHLVKSSFYEDGLNEKLVDEAIKLLNKEK